MNAWTPSRKLAAAVLVIAAGVAVVAVASGDDGDGSSGTSRDAQELAAGAGDGQDSAADGGPGESADAGAGTEDLPPPAPLPLEAEVTNTSGLRDGDEVTVTVRADEGSLVYGVEMRLCKAGATIRNDGDWLPTVAGQCATKALSPGGDGYKLVPGAPPYDEVVATYKVSTGTDTFALDDGGTASVTCDADHPCVLAVKYQIPDGFGFRTYDLTFA